MITAQTAVTQYIVAANDVKYAYRRIGIDHGTPLVMHIHFRANMDFWDPLLLNTLGSHRPVVIFDQTGVGRTLGTVPTTFQGWADDLLAFVQALDLKQIDLLGFSMGGIAVQMVALKAPQLIRRLILAGTSSSMTPAEQIPGVVWPRDQALPQYLKALSTAATEDEGKEAIFYSFFYDDAVGRAAVEAYWKRLSERATEPVNLMLLDRDGGSKNQLQSSMAYRTPNPDQPFSRLKELQMPVLIMNGDNDLLIPSSRSWEMYIGIENAQLILYPKAGHGFLWQYAELVGEHINQSLDHKDYDGLSSKL